MQIDPSPSQSRNCIGVKESMKKLTSLFLALLLFVGIPLPGTGAWTGTLAASILDMDFKSTVTAVMLGVLLAGVIMMTAKPQIPFVVKGHALDISGTKRLVILTHHL